MILMKDFKTTEEISVPEKLIGQVIGQEKAVEIIKKAARQKRNVLLIGSPGTGKSMLAQAMAEIMPVEQLEDVLAYPNSLNENQPLIRVVPTYPDFDFLSKKPEYKKYYSPYELAAIKKYTDEKKADLLPALLRIGLGRRMVQYRKPQEEQAQPQLNTSALLPIIAIIVLIAIVLADMPENTKWLILATVLGFGVLFMLSGVASGMQRRMTPFESPMPKLIVDNTGNKNAPFVDATGSKAGSLLGDVKHDPLQSGGLGTPAHLRVEGGAIHKASKGVLFIDEIASLKLNWQQDLLTSMQEKKYFITGQSEMSSGALVKTEPVPSDFVLVAAGNLPDMQHIHPALRSRIRGSGYEVYMEESMDDTQENRDKLVQFVAQEIKRDGKIPHFTREAVIEIIEEAKKMSGRKGQLTMNLREVGGLIRAAGDVAREESAKYVDAEHVKKGKKTFSSIEFQLSKKIAERKKEYQMFANTGFEIGRVNGLAVLGDSLAGLVLPIVAEVTPSASRSEGRVIATGKLGQIAKEAVDNVSAILKKYESKDLSQKDIHIQFLQTYEGVEGDSASISIAVAVISALENVPLDQSCALTGSLSVRGDVLPVGGINGKIEAAIDAGMKNVIIPKSNEGDVYIAKDRLKLISIIPAANIAEVLEHVMGKSERKNKLILEIKKQMKK
ncbi:Archaeal Lon protease [uncultured archaeon]|nr:Archaeal Lon protease [uncultured archaeon]